MLKQCCRQPRLKGRRKFGDFVPPNFGRDAPLASPSRLSRWTCKLSRDVNVNRPQIVEASRSLSKSGRQIGRPSVYLEAKARPRRSASWPACGDRVQRSRKSTFFLASATSKAHRVRPLSLPQHAPKFGHLSPGASILPRAVYFTQQSTKFDSPSNNGRPPAQRNASIELRMVPVWGLGEYEWDRR